MSVAAPLIPTREPTTPLPGAPVPELPPVLELLIASRPERERRSIALAVGGAVLVHLLLLLILLFFGPLGGHWRPSLPVAGNPEERTVTLLLPGTDLRGRGAGIAPAPAVHGAEPRLVAPSHIPSAIPPLPAPGAAPGAGAQPGAGAGSEGTPGAGAGGNMSAAERLRPHSWDRRLWESPEQLLETETDNDRVARRVQGKIDAINDSAAAVADAARKAKDWTIKDKNGNAWGIGPDGKLKLGGLSIPLLSAMQYQFQTPPGRRDDAERNQANWEEIQRSASQAEIHHTFDDRVKAIRQRKEKEHEEQKKDQASTSSSSNPPTN
jgi:hypothetical protein